MQSANGVQENIEKIARLFPNCVTETITGHREDGSAILAHKVDFEKLQQELSDSIISDKEERYQFTWPDKMKAILAANAPINAALRPCREESVDFDTTKNLYIEGDNLDVLKCLKETYLHKVKMIYIDPPYNTGNDFVYEDDFAQSAQDYLANSGQFDEQGNRLTANTESNGRFHTDWLNMIYPRLKVARDLLTEDGVIFISIDDNEVENLRKVCDEVFGESTFVANIIVRSNSRGQTYNDISKTHEYLLIYAKNSSTSLYELEKDMDSSDLNMVDSIGPFNIRELRNRNPKFGRHNRPGLFYPIYVDPMLKDKDGFCSVSLTKDSRFSVEIYPYNSIGVESCWRWGKTKFNSNNNANTLLSNVIAKEKKDGGFNIYEKYRKTTYKPKSIWDDNAVLTETGTTIFKGLGFNGEFDFPKPPELVKRCIALSTVESDICLDFFSGSATTAHAVMQLNAEDGGKRKFIMVQLPEKTEEKSEAYKAGYKNICEIGKERIRRVGKVIKEDIQHQIDSLGDQLGRMLSAKPSATASLFSKSEQAEMRAKALKEYGQPVKDKLDSLYYKLLKLDTGFRVLKLDSSNMEDIYYSPKETKQANLFNLVDNVKPGRSAEDLLFQVMLDLGATLDSKIETTEIDGKTVYNVAEGYLVACFDTDVTDSVVTAIAKMQPQYAVLRDTSMKDDSTSTNFEQIFKTYAPSTVTKIL